MDKEKKSRMTKNDIKSETETEKNEKGSVNPPAGGEKTQIGGEKKTAKTTEAPKAKKAEKKVGLTSRIFQRKSM